LGHCVQRGRLPVQRIYPTTLAAAVAHPVPSAEQHASSFVSVPSLVPVVARRTHQPPHRARLAGIEVLGYGKLKRFR
jgi:hypothetical protein